MHFHFASSSNSSSKSCQFIVIPISTANCKQKSQTVLRKRGLTQVDDDEALIC